VKSSQIEFGI